MIFKVYLIMFAGLTNPLKLSKFNQQISDDWSCTDGSACTSTESACKVEAGVSWDGTLVKCKEFVTSDACSAGVDTIEFTASNICRGFINGCPGGESGENLAKFGTDLCKLPVDCTWGEWSVWGDCEDRIRTRTRKEEIAAVNGGTCDGNPSEEEACNIIGVSGDGVSGDDKASDQAPVHSLNQTWGWGDMHESTPLTPTTDVSTATD